MDLRCGDVYRPDVGDVIKTTYMDVMMDGQRVNARLMCGNRKSDGCDIYSDTYVYVDELGIANVDEGILYNGAPVFTGDFSICTSISYDDNILAYNKYGHTMEPYFSKCPDDTSDCGYCSGKGYPSTAGGVKYTDLSSKRSFTVKAGGEGWKKDNGKTVSGVSFGNGALVKYAGVYTKNFSVIANGMRKGPDKIVLGLPVFRFPRISSTGAKRALMDLAGFDLSEIKIGCTQARPAEYDIHFVIDENNGYRLTETNDAALDRVDAGIRFGTVRMVPDSYQVTKEEVLSGNKRVNFKFYEKRNKLVLGLPTGKTSVERTEFYKAILFDTSFSSVPMYVTEDQSLFIDVKPTAITGGTRSYYCVKKTGKTTSSDEPVYALTNIGKNGSKIYKLDKKDDKYTINREYKNGQVYSKPAIDKTYKYMDKYDTMADQIGFSFYSPYTTKGYVNGGLNAALTLTWR